MTKGLHDQTANGIDFFVAKVGAKGFVEVLNWRQRANGPCVATELTEVDIIFFIVLIFDFTNDQFKDVLTVTRPETPPNSSMTIAI